MSIGRSLCGSLMFAAMAALGTPASAAVDLELRVTDPNVCRCDIIEVGLYAVSDGPSDQLLAGFQAMIGWDPNLLRLVGIENNGVNWTLFTQNDCGLDQLSNELCPPANECVSTGQAPCNDGDARLDTFSLSNVAATPEGVLGATLLFEAIGSGAQAVIEILDVAGPNSQTKVIANDPENPVLTGALGSLTLIVSECAAEPGGDFDGNCRIELFPDHVDFVDCLGGPDGGPLPAGCEPADFNDDGAADLRDAAAFQRQFTGP